MADTLMRDDLGAGRFEIGEGGDVVWADYRRDGERLYIDHVEAPLHLRGRGAAGLLMEAIVRQAKAEGRTIVPICGYAAAWLRRHRPSLPLRSGGRGPRSGEGGE